jgi:hypothetical protein
MAGHLFLTWNGAGNQPPAVGIAQVMRERGHQVIFGGFESQRRYFKERGFVFSSSGALLGVVGRTCS